MTASGVTWAPGTASGKLQKNVLRERAIKELAETAG